MPKPMYVWTGTAWVSVASEVESLATYATQSYADNQPGMKLIVPSSVSVGSGSGSVATQGTVTFSGASSIAINGCFSNVYDSYKILLTFTSASSADNNIYIKLRSDSTDASTNYSWAYPQVTIGGSVSSFNGSAQTTGFFVNRMDSGTTGYSNSSDITLHNPFAAQFTSGQITGTDRDTSGTQGGFAGGFVHATATSYNGINIISSAGTINGIVRIYGYKIG